MRKWWTRVGGAALAGGLASLVACGGSVSRALAWCARRKLELALFTLGAALRASMRTRFRPEWSYDSDLHWEVVTWIAQHHRVPPVEAVFQAQHPPLYYSLAALLYELGVPRQEMVWLSILLGCVRLILIWAALERYLPNRRWARVPTLALAAILPASIHLDGMVYPEAMSCMWICAALLLVPKAFGAPPLPRLRTALVIGVLLGLSMLTKISAIVVIGAIGAASALELILGDGSASLRFKRTLPTGAMLLTILAVCGWYFFRNIRDYGQPFVTTFDLKSQHWLVASYDSVPVLDRRSLGYFGGWNSAIYDWPYWPAAMGDQPRFFPVATASTFVDYWNFSFSGVDADGTSAMFAGSRPMLPEVLAASRYAVRGGTVIAAASGAAWLVAMRHALRCKDFGAVAVLLVPLLTLAAAMHFALKYPVDSYGVVKGVYMQFGAAPMYLLFGLAVDWSWRRVSRWPLFVLLLSSLWGVATYAAYCRLRLPLLPLG
jgi:hypothetical protein